jgi:DNA-binding NtrC family response regulator
MGKENILIVDDDKTTIDLMEELLTREGYEVHTVLSAEQGIQQLKLSSYKVVISDLVMPGKSGINLLEYCNKNFSDVPVILVTAYGTIQNAVLALKKGAFDYITKPVRIDELLLVIEKAITHQKLKTQNKFLVEALTRLDNYFFTSANENYKKILQTIDRIKDYNSTILLYGETGTGKEILGKLIHNKSQRAQASFVPLNCGAIPENLIESELFGYAKGAFTDAKADVKGKLEIADNGTLFLDEIETLSLKAQIALLRFIQEKEIIPLGTNRKINVDVRIIGATNQDLKSLINAGKFREDLYYRLNVFPIEIPPLRQRPEDILPLSIWFLNHLKREYRKQLSGFTQESEKALKAYSWPGNIRELRNCIERAVIVESSKYIQKDSLLLPNQKNSAFQFDKIGILPIKELEDAYIKWVLNKLNNNKTLASSRLGISLRNLRYRMNK